MSNQTESQLEQNVRQILLAQGLSNSQIKQGATRGKVWLQGVPSSDLGRLARPEDVAFVPDAPKITPNRDIAILHKDNDLVILWKPSGLLSEASYNRVGEPDVVSLMAEKLGDAFVVHRLDEATSGVMMVARNEKAQFEIKALLEKHEIERRYLALVRGHPTEDVWHVESQLVRDRGDGRRGSGEGADGKRARTQFKVLERLASHVSLVEATLETGRTHQVRIHLSEAGHPILGDRLYGDKSSVQRAPRVALHAAVLGLRHPISGEALYFKAPLADDLEKVRRSLMSLKNQAGPKRRPKKKKRK